MSNVRCRLCGVGILHSGTCYCHVPPRMFIARVPYVWGDLLAMTEGMLGELQIVRERRKDGPPYCYDPVPLDDPCAFIGDERSARVYEIIDGREEKETTTECHVILARARAGKGRYELHGYLGESILSEFSDERYLPFAYETTDSYGRPTVIRVLRLANIPRSPLERLADQAE